MQHARLEILFFPKTLRFPASGRSPKELIDVTSLSATISRTEYVRFSSRLYRGGWELHIAGILARVAVKMVNRVLGRDSSGRHVSTADPLAEGPARDTLSCKFALITRPSV